MEVQIDMASSQQLYLIKTAQPYMEVQMDMASSQQSARLKKDTLIKTLMWI